MRRRGLAFAVLCAVCAVGAAIAVRRAVHRAAVPATAPITGDAVVQVSAGVSLLFRSTAIDAAYGRLTLAPLANVAARQTAGALACERVDYAAGRGVCLQAARGVTTQYAAVVFDDQFRPAYNVPLAGIPSRVRVAPDGTLGAITVFVSGHSYSGGDFSTVTSVLDLRSGRYVVSNFEQLTVLAETRPFEAVDRNFWGVTFAADSDRFYATAASGGRPHLIAGTIRSRRAMLVRDDVECPSLSPGNTRLVFKRRVDDRHGPVQWRLATLDLASGDTALLSETRSVDDQVAWLDDDRIMYALPASPNGSAETNTWVLDTRTAAPPVLLVPDAYSTVVWRPQTGT
jgi:hypothetical protein